MLLLKPSTAVCSFVAVLSLLLSGCGGSGSSSSSAPTAITSDQINASAVTLAQSLSSNIAAARVSVCSNAFQDDYFCAAPIAVTSTCSGAGTAAATGQISDSWSFYASGNAFANLTVMPNACSAKSGGLVITGKPSLAVTGTVGYFYGLPLSSALTETGDVSYGPSPSGSCPVNLTVTQVYANNNNTASCKVIGTLCGQTISESCQ